MYFLYKKEYGTVKPVEIIIRRGLKWKGGNKPIPDIKHMYMKIPQ
jgi:hypothetical protein